MNNTFIEIVIGLLLGFGCSILWFIIADTIDDYVEEFRNHRRKIRELEEKIEFIEEWKLNKKQNKKW